MALRQLTGILLSLFVPRSFGATIIERQTLANANGLERLRLLYRTDGLIERLTITSYPGVGLTQADEKPLPSTGTPGRPGGFDFHALVWESKRLGQWRNKSVLTAREMEHGDRSWVCELHSFDPDAGMAVLKVGRMRTDESMAPLKVRETNARLRELHPQGIFSWCEYSWVLWDLRNRGIERTLRICEPPTEPLDGWPERAS